MEEMADITCKRVDVICPVYNKRDLVKDFMRSAMQLPADLVNIIMINDGSIDGTEDVINKIIESEGLQNFYLINKPNGGVSTARNMGIDLAKSDYIWFCDPDDLVMTGAIDAIAAIEGSLADVWAFSFIEHDVEDDKSFARYLTPQGEMTSEQFLDAFNFFSKNNGISTIWNKFFLRKTIGDIRFTLDMHHSEDRCFNLDVLTNAETTVTAPFLIYQYNKYPSGTLSTARTQERINNIIEANLKNLATLSKFRKIEKDQKVHIYKISKELAMIKDKGVATFYLREHKKYKIRILPFLSSAEMILFITLMTRAQWLFRLIIKKTKRE